MKETGHAFYTVLLRTMESKLLELVPTGVCGCDTISRFIKVLDKLMNTRCPDYAEVTSNTCSPTVVVFQGEWTS